MLKPTQALKHYIESQRSKEELAKRWDVALTTVYKIYNGEGDVEGNTIGKILADTGFAFENAFKHEED